MAWTSPTSFNDPNSKWSSEEQSYDGQVETAASSFINKKSTWSYFIELEIDEIICKTIRFHALSSADITQIDVDLYYQGDWHDLYEGAFDDATWVEKSMVNHQYVTKARVRFYASAAATAYLYEFEFNEIVSGLINGYFMQDGTREEKFGYFMNAVEAFGYYMNPLI